MDALSPHDPCQRVNLKFCSQSGKTEVILNFIGFIIDIDPGPTMAVQPNAKPMGESFSKDRISPMLRDTPTLTDKVASPRSRDSANTMLHKAFPAGHLTIASAASPAGLASRPIRYLLNDELDRWEVTKEGHALLLARKRTQTFFNRKELNVSSPTFDDFGIDAEYKNSDQQYERHLVCPDCGKSQFPALKHFIWPKGEPHKATYNCEHCGVSHSLDMEDRLKMSGEWVCVKNVGDLSKGFWLNQWASPFATWLGTIREFLDAKKDPSRLQAVTNTAFAETWRELGESVDDAHLLARRENYSKDDIPAGVLVIVAAVDCQDDRVELEVIGYGEQDESWGLEYQVIYGDPAQREIWSDLARALQKNYMHPCGAQLHIASTCIDSGGHHTKEVYDFCKNFKARRVFAIKGAAGEGRAIVSAPSKKRYGKQQRPVQLFTVGVDSAKSQVYANLRISEPGAGYCHFPAAYTEEYFAQLTAEKIVTRLHKGFPVREFVKTRPRNEALDIRGYALAALRLLNPNYQILKKQLKTESAPPVVAPEEPKSTPVRKRPRRGGFVNKW